MAGAIESISNNRMRALKIGAQAVGALALGALAVGALAIGTLAIGRLVIGRSRIRRLQVDELIVGKLYIETLTAPSMPSGDDKGQENQTARFNKPSKLDRCVNKLFGLLVGFGMGLRHNYLLQVRGRKSGRLYSTPVDVLERNGKRYLVAPR